MLPDVHDQNRFETGRHPVLMQRNPMIRKSLGYRVLIQDGPADAAHFSDGGKRLMPVVETVEALLDGALEIGGRTAFALCRKVFKIILVQHHAAVFESQATRQLGVSRV